MFFILSKILLFLLNPSNWILICLIWFFIAKKAIVKKRLLIVSFVIFILFTNYWVYSICVKAWQPKVEHPFYKQTYSAGIVLCGMTVTDKKEGSFFGGNTDRFLQTCRLYHAGVIKKIFISGGDGSLMQDKPKEADFLRKEFVAQNIPDSVLIVEHFSRNTFESAVMARHYLDSLHIAGPYILITSAEHIPRSLLAFKKAGMQVVPHAAGFNVVNSNISFIDYLMPNIGVMAQWKSFIKEVVGIWTYKFTGKA
ncbi:MAG: YdcF family protein [Chitinophagaceae bacterium]|nr:YdcF family protein [Chitinophagaceae bacterium]